MNKLIRRLHKKPLRPILEQKSGAEPGYVDFRESVKAIKENPVMVAEMLEVTDYLIYEVEVAEKEYSPTTMYEDYALKEYSLAVAEQCVAEIAGGVVLYNAKGDGQEDPAVCAEAEQG